MIDVVKRLAVTLLLVLAAVSWRDAALGQGFVFVSDRVPRSAPSAGSADAARQSDLFLYREGSELRLTRTDDQSEYDPAPSPSGAYVAFVVTDDIDTAAADGWRWYLSVIDPLLGRAVERWELPRTMGITRPAGGFQLRWLADDAGLLVQVPDAAGGWEVLRFLLGASGGERVSGGYGIAPSPAGDAVATERDGITWLVDLAARVERPVIAGTPLGWANDRLFVTTPGSLRLVAPEDSAAEEIFTFRGTYDHLRWSPDGRHYAFVVTQEAGCFIIVATADHQMVEDYLIPGYVDGLDWLAADTLVFSFEQPDTHLAIGALRLDGGDPILVDSWANDHSPRTLPR